MSNVSVTMKRKRFEKVYKSHADDIYRVCLYFSKDEKKAKDATEQVFVEFYKEFQEVDFDHIFAHLVHKAKRLLSGEQVHHFARRRLLHPIISR